MNNLKIQEIKGIKHPDLIGKLLDVWNESVRLTHGFLTGLDIESLYPYVKEALLSIQHLIVVLNCNQPIGFMGICRDKIEMLFLSPDYLNRGIGSLLIEIAECRYGVKWVDVNEQNDNAVRFYIHKNFKVYGRDELDVQGNSLPILHMVKENSITIEIVENNKKDYMDFLMLGDEQEDMIARYLERGKMFVMKMPEQGMPVCVAVVTDEGNNVCELKNIAVIPQYQRKGYGRKMINFICCYYMLDFATLMVGTGDTISNTSFYKSNGFVYSHIIKDFFTNNYDHIIEEDGIVLKDMIYFRKEIGNITKCAN